VKVAILAGGLGSRLSEETETRPKPMVEVGGMPILWHIMKYYAHFGFNDFAIGLGYKGIAIKRFMLDYPHLAQDLTVNMRTGESAYSGPTTDNWTVNLVETGQNTDTGGRVKRLRSVLGDSTFMLTWGDGVSDVDLHALLAFHRSHGKLATLTAVHPPARFGKLDIGADGSINDFVEKPEKGEGRINGAFFVLEPGIFDYIDGDDTSFERGPLVELAKEGQLMAYQHDGFWQCMDTLRDRMLLESLWASPQPPWKVWP
jgi:glucose-1-phosphate cytidylyltransferase